jgi:hypothetical protein
MIGLGILIATMTAFVISFAFYAVAPTPSPFAANAPGVATRPRWWQILIELLRSALVASLIAGLVVAAAWHGPLPGLLLGLALGVLPILLLAGSVLWEQVPVRAAATHAIDWIIKLAAIGTIVGIFA